MVQVIAIMLLVEARQGLCFWRRQDMIYSMLLLLITFLATRHVVAKDLAFSSPLNNPPRGTNGIHKGVASENHCPLEGQVEEKDYDIDVIKVMSHYT